MNRVEMNEEMMAHVDGGVIVVYSERDEVVLIHDDCGGEIEWSLIHDCVCQKCKETHWWKSDFNYHKEYR